MGLQSLIRRSGLGKTDAVLFLAAFCLYLPGIDWGLPHADSSDRVDVWATDDISPLAPLTEVYNTFVGAGSDRYLIYPLGHHFLLAAAYSPYLAWLKATGGFGAPSATFPFGLRDPVTTFQVLTLIARLVSVLMAACTALAAYRIGRMLWDRRTGIWAFVFCAVPYPMFYYSKTGNLEVPVLFWTSLGLLAYARILTAGLTASRAAALGAFAALAAATKDQGAAAFLLMPLGLIFAPRTSLWKPAAALLVTGSSVYAVASGLAFEPSRWIAHVAYLFDAEDHYSRFARFVTWYPSTMQGWTDHLADVVMSQVAFLGPLVMVASIRGMVRTRVHGAFVLPALGHLLLFLLPLGYFYVRFAMPLAFVHGIFAARGVSFLRVVSRRAAAGWVAVLLAWPVVLSVDLTYQMLRDSRYDAERWFGENAARGQRVAHFGVAGELPRLPDGVETVRLRPDDAAFDDLERLRPEIVVIQPDWTSGPDLPHSGWCPPELYRSLDDGSAGYRLAATFHTPSLVNRRLLDYPTVNPPIRLYVERRRVD